MPAPRYVDAVRRQPPQSQAKEITTHRQAAVNRGSGGGQTATTQSASQKSPPLPHDPRLIYTFAAAMGRRVSIQVKSGVVFEGTLYGPVLGSKNIHITLKTATKMDKGEAKQHYETLVIPANEFVQMKATGVPFPLADKTQNGHQGLHAKQETSSKTGSEYTDEKFEYDVMPVKDEHDMSGFMGDIDRAAAVPKPGGAGRALVAWNGGDSEGEEVVLDGDTGGWCQFKAKPNAGLQSTFDMNDYTSKLDVQQSRYTEEEAARIAAEIEAAPRGLPAVVVDDSGVLEEETPPPVREEAPRAKPFSWADAVKGKGTPAPVSVQPTIKKPVAGSVRKAPEKMELEARQSPVAVQNASQLETFVTPMEPVPHHRMSHTAVYDVQQPYVEKQENVHKSFGYDTPPAPFLPEPETIPPPPPAFAQGKESDGVYTGYATLNGTVEPAAVGERPSGFQVVTENVSVDKPSTQYYGDPLWGPPPNDQIPVKTQSTHSPQPEPLEQSLRETVTQEATVVSPVVLRPEPKKASSTVVPGISFRDKVRANLPAKAPKPVTPQKQRTPQAGGHRQTPSQSSFVDTVHDPVVQSPRQSGYSGKLISNPRRNDLHPADAGRGLPSEENLLSPVTVPHPMAYPPPPAHDYAPGTVGPMPRGPPGGYPDMPPPLRPPYGGFGPLMMPPPGLHTEVMAGAPPPAHYPHPSQGNFSPVSETGQEEGGLDSAGRNRRRFQLNPMAKAFKPVVSLDGPPEGSEPYPPEPLYAPPPQSDFETRTPQGEVVPPVVPPPPGAPTQTPQQTPKQPGTPGEGPPPPEYNGTPHHPGARPPFLPQSNVVTPWPSFPGTGVWHSGLGTPRPGTPQANAMMNGFMPPGMPSPYPVFVPGMPPPYMGGMQEPMWRPHPMPPGMPDQQSIAMMWSSYYNQIVPPEQRVWNPSKFPNHAGPMVRPARGHRRPPSGNNNPTPPNFSAQSPTTQPSGEMP